MHNLKRFLPALISALLLLVLVFYAPWPKVFKTFTHLDIAIIASLIVLSILYYAVKTVRFWFMLKAIKINKPFWMVGLSYMSAQPVTLLPGGEIYRSKTLEQFTGVPMKKSISQFTTQGVLEAMAMAIVSFVTVMTTSELRLPFLIAALVILVAFFFTQRGGLAHLYKPLNKLPFVSVSQKAIDDFSKANQKILARRRLPLLLILSVIGELLGVAIAYLAILGVGGKIEVSQAVLLYIIPMIASFISLLPAGLGVAEHSGVVVLALDGASTAVAVAATLVMRVTIVGFGVIYGVLINSFSRMIKAKTTKFS